MMRPVIAGVLGLVVPAMAFAAQTEQKPIIVEHALAKPVGADCRCPIAPVGQLPVALEGAALDTRNANVLAARICADATRLPKGATTDDLEAAIVFAVSQSAAKPAVVRAALDLLAACDYGQQNFAAALRRVGDALSNRTLRRGTAAIGGGASFQSSFTAPSVNIGGGSSNYTR